MKTVRSLIWCWVGKKCQYDWITIFAILRVKCASIPLLGVAVRVPASATAGARAEKND